MQGVATSGEGQGKLAASCTVLQETPDPNQGRQGASTRSTPSAQSPSAEATEAVTRGLHWPSNTRHLQHRRCQLQSGSPSEESFLKPWWKAPHSSAVSLNSSWSADKVSKRRTPPFSNGWKRFRGSQDMAGKCEEWRLQERVKASWRPGAQSVSRKP